MSSKAESSYVFKLDIAGPTPSPTEISVYARDAWLERYVHLNNLLTEWTMFVDWQHHITDYIEWFVGLSYNQRDELAPRFTNGLATDYYKELWTGWIYERGQLTYKSIPRENPDFTEYSGSTRWTIPDATDDEFPYLYNFNVTDNIWFHIAHHSAVNYIESGIKARAALNSGKSVFHDNLDKNKDDVSDANSGWTYRDIDFDNPYGGWTYALIDRWKLLPLEAIKWFLSLTEDQRSLYAPRWVSKSSVPDHKFVLYYDQGLIHRDILPDTDPRAQNGTTW